jgi:hypothetical protein
MTKNIIVDPPDVSYEHPVNILNKGISAEYATDDGTNGTMAKRKASRNFLQQT